MKNRIILTAIIGNILEYYDFAIYSVFYLQIAKAFFPTSDLRVQILLALAVFALGSFARPFGGIIFGHLGDRYGRKVSLTAAMLGMAVPTLCIALIPSYDQIGIYAPILLIVFRMFQGLSVSGEGASAAIFLLEHFYKWRPGLLSSIVMASNTLGALLATCIGILISKIDELDWRVAFIIGGMLGLVGIYLRIKISETPTFQLLQQQNKILKFPLVAVFKNNAKNILICACIGGTTASFSYFVKTYLNVLFTNFLGYSQDIALGYVAFCTGLLMLFIPFFGWLSDKIGFKQVIIGSAYISIIAIIPTIMLTQSHNNMVILLALVIFALLTSSISAPAYRYAVTLFPPEQRISGVAFSYNLGIACLGGTAPFIFTYLNNITHLNYAAGFYIIFTSILLLIVLKLLDKK